jgi:hypothetical protein
MKRPLIVGVRPSGAHLYRIRIFGHADNRFPPAELSATLNGLAQWLSHGRATSRAQRDPEAPLLRLV